MFDGQLGRVLPVVPRECVPREVGQKLQLGALLRELFWFVEHLQKLFFDLVEVHSEYIIPRDMGWNILWFRDSVDPVDG